MCAACGLEPLAEPEPGDVEQATNWRQGGLYFREATLRDIFDELERRYKVDLFSNDPTVLGARRTWHKHDPGTVEALLEELCAPTGCRYRPTANGAVRARRAQCARQKA